MNNIRYGIIGSGMMGIEHMMNIATIDGAEVTALADPDENSQQIGKNAAGDIATFASHRDLLSEGLCDAVVIAAPNFRHHEIMKDVLDSGTHMLTEKPMCITTEECLDVIDHAEGSQAVN